MISSREHLQVVAETSSGEGTHTSQLTVDDGQSVFTSWTTVFRELDKITQERIFNASTTEAALAIEKPFSHLFASARDETTANFQNCRTKLNDILRGDCEVGESLTMSFFVRKPDKIVVRTFEGPIEYFSYQRVPYLAEEFDDDYRVNLDRNKKKCYEPIDNGTLIPGSFLVLSFTKLSDDELGVYVDGETGYLPDSFFRKYLYKKFL